MFDLVGALMVITLTELLGFVTGGEARIFYEIGSANYPWLPGSGIMEEMKVNRFVQIAGGVMLLMGAGMAACGMVGDSVSVDLSSLPELSSLEAAPFERFILDDAGLAKVSRSQPFMGSDGTSSTCQHNGAHVHFLEEGADYTVNIIAPAHGIVSFVDPCRKNGDHDKVDIWLAVAKQDGEQVDLEYSIEPMAGYLCSGGDDGADNGFFEDYISVEEGQEVEAGEVIAQFYRKSTPHDDSAHIHYALQVSDSIACPDIFSSALKTTLFSLFDVANLPSECQGFTFSESTAFCLNPDASEAPF